MNEEAQLSVTSQLPPPLAASSLNTNNPLYGIHGWLKFVVIVNLYIVPILFVISQIFSWIVYTNLARRYPGILLVGLIDSVVSGFLVIRNIQIAIGLRDIKPRAVQNAKALLKLCLVWTFVSIPLNFLSGLGAEKLLLGILKRVLIGVTSFAIWYSYFNVSKRVQATYPDWKD
jgi:hypothetical protein